MQVLSLLESLDCRADILPLLTGNTGEIFHGTLTNIKNRGADAARVDKLASRLNLHAQHTMHYTEPPSRGEIRGHLGNNMSAHATPHTHTHK